MYCSAVNQQQMRGQVPPSVQQSGPVEYGSGIVFGGMVYPVLVDGVPMQPPAGAHQAAVQQRMQMQQGQPIMAPKTLPPQRVYERVGTPARTQAQNHQAFGRFPGAVASPASSPAPGPAMYSNPARLQQLQLQQLQQQQQQQLRQQQLQAAMAGSYPSSNFIYNQPPSAGGDCWSGWSGYAMMPPSDASKPYMFGFD